MSVKFLLFLVLFWLSGAFFGYVIKDLLVTKGKIQFILKEDQVDELNRNLVKLIELNADYNITDEDIANMMTSPAEDVT